MSLHKSVVDHSFASSCCRPAVFCRLVGLANYDCSYDSNRSMMYVGIRSGGVTTKEGGRNSSQQSCPAVRPVRTARWCSLQCCTLHQLDANRDVVQSASRCYSLIPRGTNLKWRVSDRKRVRMHSGTPSGKKQKSSRKRPSRLEVQIRCVCVSALEAWVKK
jgi:hypothetical protein